MILCKFESNFKVQDLENFASYYMNDIIGRLYGNFKVNLAFEGLNLH